VTEQVGHPTASARDGKPHRRPVEDNTRQQWADETPAWEAGVLPRARWRRELPVGGPELRLSHAPIL
jgi:hypothetical protein